MNRVKSSRCRKIKSQTGSKTPGYGIDGQVGVGVTQDYGRTWGGEESQELR